MVFILLLAGVGAGLAAGHAAQRPWEALRHRQGGRHPALFSPANYTTQLFMWPQRDIVGVAPYIMACSDMLGALDDAPGDASISSPSALAAG